MNKFQELANIIKESNNIVVFSGAGISTASGIPDFRSSKGIYQEKFHQTISPEEIISHTFFVTHPDIFYEFYKKKMCYPNALPNKAHLFFSELQRYKNVIVVTQNIDGLHQKAGSKIVYELHGSIHRNYCTHCARAYDLDFILNAETITYCPKCGHIIKPDVVLYEEPLDENVINLSIFAIMTCDTLIVVGTSLMVYPANSFIRYFKGHKLVLINKDSTAYDHKADLVINDDIINVVNEVKKYL